MAFCSDAVNDSGVASARVVAKLYRVGPIAFRERVIRNRGDEITRIQLR